MVNLRLKLAWLLACLLMLLCVVCGVWCVVSGEVFTVQLIAAGLHSQTGNTPRCHKCGDPSNSVHGKIDARVCVIILHIDVCLDLVCVLKLREKMISTI